MKDIARDIIKQILSGDIKNEKQLLRAKSMHAKEQGTGKLIKNAEILEYAKQDELEDVLPLGGREKSLSWHVRVVLLHPLLRRKDAALPGH